MNYVKTAVIVLITTMVLSLALTYASILTIVQTSKDRTERVLKSFVTENSTLIFNSIKNGNDFTSALNADYFIATYLSDGTLDSDGGYLYNKNDEGGTIYRLTVPQTTFTIANTLNLTCSYNLQIPVTFAGRTVTELIIPIKVKTSFNLKSG